MQVALLSKSRRFEFQHLRPNNAQLSDEFIEFIRLAVFDDGPSLTSHDSNLKPKVTEP